MALNKSWKLSVLYVAENSAFMFLKLLVILNYTVIEKTVSQVERICCIQKWNGGILEDN